MIKGGRIDDQPVGLQTKENLTVSPDGTKRALTVDGSNQMPSLIGWIDQRAYHPLPITQPYLPDDATPIVAW